VPEFGNVRWKRVRRRECPQLVASSDLAVRAFELPNELGQPVYDCLYLALVIEVDATLATADRQLARAARSRLEHLELIA
jgi:predicted nucleic acid-binding protein